MHLEEPLLSDVGDQLHQEKGSYQGVESMGRLAIRLREEADALCLRD